MTSLAIGIGIGLAFGVILMLLSIPPRNSPKTQNLDEMDTNDEQYDDAGFIEIDYGRMSPSEKFEDSESVYGLKRKLARFKLKNRFYN